MSATGAALELQCRVQDFGGSNLTVCCAFLYFLSFYRSVQFPDPRGGVTQLTNHQKLLVLLYSLGGTNLNVRIKISKINLKPIRIEYVH